MNKHTLWDRKHYYTGLLAALVLLSLISVAVSLLLGYYKIPFAKAVEALFSANVTPEAVVLRNVRLPRVIAAFLIGAALSVSGSAYQGMFRNPLVSPDILGVAGGAGLGASIAISLRLPAALVQTFAFLLGLLVVLLSHAVSRRVRFTQTVSLILAGTMLGSMCFAATTMLKYTADTADTLPAITFWLMGSLARADFSGVAFSLAPMLAGFIMIFIKRHRMDLLTLDDEESRSIGINPQKLRFYVIIAATLLSAGAVCLGGLIGWVGLMIPHMVRALVGPQYRRMLPVSVMLGGSFLLLMDDLARSLSTMEIPLGMLTAFVGAPFFLLLLFTNRIWGE